VRKIYSKRWTLLFVTIFLLTTLASAIDPLADQSATQVNVTLKSSIYLPTPRPIQDVFLVLNNTTLDLVYRVERSEAEDPINLEKEVYATVNATPHDVYKITPHPLGPFPKGKDLGFTLGQWLTAIGTGTYSEANGNATMNLTFRSLVPNGTYTVWVHRVTMPPDYEYVFMPVGASDGSQNVFKADADGNGAFNLTFEALPPSTNVTYPDYVAMYVTKKIPINTKINWTLISMAYHSDGKTYGATPGELGKTAHMQLTHLMYPKPARTYEEWKNATSAAASTSAATAKPQEKQPGFEGIIAVVGLLAAYCFARNER
jgi:hypothetical protein